MEYRTLTIGEVSENGQVEIIDQDRLCFKIASHSKGAYGIRTISKDLLNEFFRLYIEKPNITANEARELLSGQSDIDKFEYGYASTLWQMAKMLDANPIKDNINRSIQRQHSVKSIARQVIYYGAPGTGKSHRIKEQLEGVSKANIFRTTFHSDSDYSTFVGAYKPTRGKRPLYGLNGELTVRLKDNGNELSEETITYKFVPQAFLNAYIRAYETYNDVYLIVEEINRGNCAQIFGDLFQLLDRDKNGVSEYTIKADADLKAFLEEKLGEDNPGIKDGELCLPSNLYIYATMNTSDQSLFPIDSAFKRRWDWKYVPIAKGNDNGTELNWMIDVDGNLYDWWTFVRTINKYVFDTTNSEDKQLGFFFCKAHNSIISAETFVCKVIFYLWNDVFKDFGFDDKIFEDKEDNENPKLSFDKFYMANGNVNEGNIKMFLENLGMMPIEEYSEEVDDESENSNGKTIPKYSINGSSEQFSTPNAVRYIIENYAKQNENISVDEMIQLWNGIAERNNLLVPTWQPSPNDNQSFANKRRVKIEWGNCIAWLIMGWTEALFKKFIQNVKQKLDISIERVN